MNPKNSLLQSLFLLTIILLFFGRFFFSSQLFDTHDLEYHAARTANYYLAVQEGQFPPRWSSNLNYSFGLPTFIFAYPLPYIFATLFFVVLGDIQESINASLLLFWLAGGIGMFLYAHARLSKRIPALLVSTTYFAAPYTLLNFFERGAFGEVSFYAFLPWVLLCIHWQNKIQKAWFLLFSYLIFVCFLLTHPQSVVITIPLLFLWCVVIYPKRILKVAWQQKTLLVLSAGLTVLFFWIPLFQESKFTLISGSISLDKMLDSFPIFSRLFLPNNPASQVIGSQMLFTDFSTTLGLASIVILLFGLYLLAKNRLQRAERFWLFILFLSIFFMHPISSFIWKHIGPLKVLQFPWRLLFISVIASSMLWIEFFQKTSNKRSRGVIFLFLIFVAISNLAVWGKPKNYISRSNYEWFEYFGTASSFNEFVPRTFDHEKNMKVSDPVAFATGSGNIALDKSTGSTLRYTVTAESHVRVLQKTAFFPGWQVWANGKQIVIDQNNPDFPGRITFELPAGAYEITSKFTEQVPDRIVANYLSIFGITIFLALLIPKCTLQRHQNNE